MLQSFGGKLANDAVFKAGPEKGQLRPMLCSSGIYSSLATFPVISPVGAASPELTLCDHDAVCWIRSLCRGAGEGLGLPMALCLV